MSIESPSDQIKQKIKETGIKQVHLAKKLGISPQHLNTILSKNQENSQYMPKIAEILGLEQPNVEKLVSIESPSDQIKQKIKETGIKQVHLAKKLGISPQHLNEILSKNQDNSQYIPKLAKILGFEQPIVELDNIKNIPILSEPYLKFLSEGSISFEDLNHIVFKSWPSIIKEDYYFFGYELRENLNSEIIKNDLLIFSTYIPCDITRKIGIAFINDMMLIFTGKLKYNQKIIVIYNEHKSFEFKIGDQLLGTAVYLERNIEKWTK
ncbi:MAG: helix-turn-helix transcriptional regulator [Tatlockia sp.]|nr:helix-turn-helix transcriptional regulator [Tatlockia sp.]